MTPDGRRLTPVSPSWSADHPAEAGFLPESEPWDDPATLWPWPVYIRSLTAQRFGDTGKRVWVCKTSPCPGCQKSHTLRLGLDDENTPPEVGRFTVPCGAQITLRWGGSLAGAHQEAARPHSRPRRRKSTKSEVDVP